MPTQPSTQSDAQASTTSTPHGVWFAGIKADQQQTDGVQLSTSAAVVGTWIIEQGDADPLVTIENILKQYPQQPPAVDGGWLIMLSYELGQVLEPKAKSSHRATQSGFPLAVLQRWESAGESINDEPGEYRVGKLRSSMGKDGYIAAVERTQAYINAGDIYQANIAHHLTGSFSGCALSCFQDLVSVAHPRFGAMMIFDHHRTRHAILSISPELFVECDLQGKTIATEPMKGTRPIGADPDELRGSIKDRAELDMITDLMRNDLGRICTLGSVRVVEPRAIESHGSGVLQASSRIEGQLANGVGIAQTIQAVFPPGSVTGAPKIRAMQIINELEDTPRNSYCGSMIALDDQGRISASVSIRTAHIKGDACSGSPVAIDNAQFIYPVGAGLVADSDPESEWAETLLKAEVLRVGLGVELDVKR